MLVIPRPSDLPAPSLPVVQAFPGLAELRRQTHWFIENDPTPISLVPVAKQAAPGGGWNVSPLAPRSTQRFKLIPQSTADGVVQTADGTSRRFDYILLGEWNAIVAIGDMFTEPEHSGQKWVVQGLLPYNGYEIKAGIVSYGKNPQHG